MIVCCDALCAYVHACIYIALDYYSYDFVHISRLFSSLFQLFTSFDYLLHAASKQTLHVIIIIITVRSYKPFSTKIYLVSNLILTQSIERIFSRDTSRTPKQLSGDCASSGSFDCRGTDNLSLWC